MSDFGKAFRSARASGQKVFSYGGKSYTTKLKSETAGVASSKAPAKKTVPTPTPRPSTTDTNAAQAAVDSAPKAAKAPDATKTAPQQNYPRPAKTVAGVARPNSIIGQAAAKQANKPFTPAPVTAGTSPRSAKNTQPATTDVQGPKPEGVFYAAKGSAMSQGAARRANAPKPLSDAAKKAKAYLASRT